MLDSGYWIGERSADAYCELTIRSVLQYAGKMLHFHKDSLE